jgi:gas vesicle protein
MPDSSRAMPDKSEVIMGQMDDTRKDLADKIEQLEKKVSGTVESVTDLVEKVPETVETVKETIQETVSTVKGSVEDTVEAVKGSVKNFFDIPHHVDRHPWLMMGGSVLLGFLGGRLLLPRPRAAEETAAGEAPGTSTPPSYGYSAAAAQVPEARYAERREEEPARESWLTRLGDQFGGELSKVKGLALGTLFGVARDTIAQWVPETLKKDVTEIVNNFTSNLGGKVIHGPVLGQGDSSPQESSSREGGGHNQPEPQRTEEPALAAARKGGRR